MRPDVNYIQQRFNEFNAQMFGGRLPSLPIRLTDAASFGGKVTFQTKSHRDGSRTFSNFVLHISVHRDLPASDVDDTIIHEMIHYFIMYNGLQDATNHGPIFRALMESINATYGRHITISRKFAAPALADVPLKWRVVGVIRFTDGTCGIKVLPRTGDSILKWESAASSQPKAASVDFYVSDHPFFGRFPSSGALKFHSVNPDDLNTYLQGAQKIGQR